MRILRDETLAPQNGGHGNREVTLAGDVIKELVAQFPDGDTLEVDAGPEGGVVLTLVPPFQTTDQTPHYPDMAHVLAPLKVVREDVADGRRIVELSPGQNLIQRLLYLRAELPETAALEVEPGYSGNPFSVRIKVV